MKNNTRVIIKVLFCLVVLLAASYTGYRLWQFSVKAYSRTLYEKDLKLIQDSLSELRANIYKFEVHITDLEMERKTLKKDIQFLLKQNEKINLDIDNNTLDANIEFLTEYLSTKNSPERGHRDSNNFLPTEGD